MFTYLKSKLFPVRIDTTNYVPEILKDYVLLSGSRRWNVHTETSDVDLALKENDVETLCTILALNRINYKKVRTGYSNVLSAIIFYLNDLKYEVSIMTIKNFETCQTILPILDNFAKDNKKFKKKDYRVLMFDCLQSAVYYNNFTDLPTDLTTFLKEHYPELSL